MPLDFKVSTDWLSCKEALPDYDFFSFGIIWVRKHFCSHFFLLKELLALFSILHNFDLDFITPKSLNAKF